MIYLHHLGVTLPALGFGTAGLTGRHCEAAVTAALALGYRHIDTAAYYDNEAAVGRAIADSGIDRAELFLTTKVWHNSLTPGQVRASADRSLAALGTDYVDLLLVHWPNPAIALAETLGAFQALQQEGRIRQIGVSNFPVALLRQAFALLDDRLFCNQVEYHAGLSQQPVLDYLRPRGGIVVAYQPLAGGTLLRQPTVTAIADRHGRTPAQVCLRWLLQQSQVAAIPKAASHRHAAENLQALEFALTADDMAALNGVTGVGRQINPAWAPAWDREWP